MDNVEVVEVIEAEEEEELLVNLEKMKQERERRLQQEFSAAYQALVRKHGYHIVGLPAFVPNRSGTFEIMVNLAVEKLQ